MNTNIEFALKNFFSSRKDIFGVNSEFLRFVEETDFGRANGFTSTTMFGKIEYLRDEIVKQSDSLAIKYTRDNETLMKFYLMPAIKNELFFYTKILPYFEQYRSVSHLFPKFYSNLSVMNSNKIENVLIIENLKSSEYRHFSQGFQLDLDHLSLMMRIAADLHASSFRLKKLDPFNFRCMVHAISDVNSSFAYFHWKLTKVYFESAAKILSKNPKYASRLQNVEQFIERLRTNLLESVKNDTTDPTLVLCHGDFIAQNCLFKYENGKPIDAKMVDNGHCKLSNPMRDLVHLLMVNASKEMRDRYWNYLIDVYYETLGGLCEEIPSKENITKGTLKYIAYVGHAAASLVPLLEGFQKGILKPNDFEIKSVDQVAKAWKIVDSSTPKEILEDLLERTTI